MYEFSDKVVTGLHVERRSRPTFSPVGVDAWTTVVTDGRMYTTANVRDNFCEMYEFSEQSWSNARTWSLRRMLKRRVIHGT